MSIVPVAVRRPVRARDPHEEGRAATPLELLFDLVFVVAVASNATELHHGLTEGTAVGSAVAAAVDVVTGASEHGRGVLVALALAISAAVLALSGMHAAGEHGWRVLLPGALVALGCLLVALVVPSVPWAVLLMGLVLAGLVVHKVRLAGAVPA